MGNNLIDRQVAIDALKEHRALYCDNTPDTFSKLSYAEKSRVDELDTAIATLVNLPSAQPELIAQGAYVRGFEQGRTQGMLDAKLEPTCNQLATDTISRQAAIDAFTHKWDGMVTSVFDVINSLPSAQPEIIYCKDCVKHNKGHGYYYDGTVIGIKDCCPLVEIRGRAQGHEFDYQFCAYAERRTDE